MARAGPFACGGRWIGSRGGHDGRSRGSTPNAASAAASASDAAATDSKSGCTSDFQSVIYEPVATTIRANLASRWPSAAAFGRDARSRGGQGSNVPLRIHSSAIRYFDAVRRAQSIREAARQLNVASSAVNRQIIKLEEEIGEPLFHRLPSGLVLTPVGEALARHVITVFQDLERTGAEIDDIHGARVGHITVAVVESVASSILPQGDRPEPRPGAAGHLHRLGDGILRYSRRRRRRRGRRRGRLRAAQILGAAAGVPRAVQARRDRAAGPSAGEQQDRQPVALPRLSDDPRDAGPVDQQPARTRCFRRGRRSCPRSSPPARSS